MEQTYKKQPLSGDIQLLQRLLSIHELLAGGHQLEFIDDVSIIFPGRFEQGIIGPATGNRARLAREDEWMQTGRLQRTLGKLYLDNIAGAKHPHHSLVDFQHVVLITQEAVLYPAATILAKRLEADDANAHGGFLGVPGARDVFIEYLAALRAKVVVLRDVRLAVRTDV